MDNLQGWIKTTERRPEACDASHTGMVLAVKANNGPPYVTVVKHGYCTPKAYPLWMPYPDVPEDMRQWL